MLEALEPRAVFSVFEALCAIPHGSGNTDRIAAFCVDYARARGLAASRDGANNVIIRVPASAGYEEHPTVILQGHTDMVCEKDPDCTLDFARDGLRLRTEGDSVFAEGTTLGGDDGIAVAMALSLLDSDAPHPPLELVLTADEEIGMLGADALDASVLQGRILLNLDSESEGVFTVACAGGAHMDLTLPVTRAPFAGDCLSLRLCGLAGGHSGEMIGAGRENADMLLAGLLRETAEHVPFRLAALAGGGKDNAIPREATALLCVERGARDALLAYLSEAIPAYLSRFRAIEPEIRTELSDGAAADALTEADSRRVIDLLCALPSGVQSRVPGSKDVQTSLNLGILSLGQDRLTAGFLVRSSVNAERDALTDRLIRTAERFGGAYEMNGTYPAWEFRPDSALREMLCATWRELTGREARVVSIHAGLECGVFCGKLPGLECVSFGPDLADIHTSRERMSISSVARCYQFLLAALRRL